MSFLSKIKGAFAKSPKGDEGVEKAPKYGPSPDDPLDLQFVKTFTSMGGQFFYVQPGRSVTELIEMLCSEKGLSGVNVISDELQSLSFNNAFAASYGTTLKHNTVVTTCEALCAYNGGIMIHEYHTGGLKLKDLPEHQIIIGKTSQIVPNLHEGLTRINHTYKSNRPGNISMIKPPLSDESIEEGVQLASEAVVFLLLVEDELE